MTTPLEIFLVSTPGLSEPLRDELIEKSFNVVETNVAGVQITGDWAAVWRANLQIRGATRVLVRVATFRAMHPAQLDKRARKVDWASVLRPDVPVRVEATTRKSRIYHAGAAVTRIENALREVAGITITKDAQIVIKVRIDDDLCTISVDTTGASLHLRGHKEAVNKAPMRETMAAMFLRCCGYDGNEPVFDPMCGSGTFPIEAAEIAAGLYPGRSRSFAFENLAGFDEAAWSEMKAVKPTTAPELTFYGTDRDVGAIKMSQQNAERASVSDLVAFQALPISEAMPPAGQKGLVIVNPPYGGRIGQKGPLYGLYAAMGAQLMQHFQGWRVGLITTEAGLAKATGLPWHPPGPIVAHGGLRIRLWQTGPL